MCPSQTRRVVVILGACLSLATTALAQAPIDISHEVLTILDLPNASGAYGKSLLADRNVHGLTVGGFGLSGLTLPEGSFTLTLTPTGAVAKLFTCGADVLWTMAKAVNRHPAIVGWCYTVVNDQATVDGFYRSESTKITRLRPPGSRLSEATDVNDQHVVVGWEEDQAGGIHGYRWTRSTGKFERIDAPFPGAWATIPTAINNAGHIVATILTTGVTVGGLLKQGQWSLITITGAEGTSLEDLTDQGAILGHTTIPNGYNGYFLLENGTAVAIQATLPQVETSAVLAVSPQRQAVGSITTTIPPRDQDAGDTWIIADQGFIAPLPAVLGEPLTPPGPQMAAHRTPVASAMPTTPANIQRDGCPDEAPPAGMRRVGKLAMSWVGCARLR